MSRSFARCLLAAILAAFPAAFLAAGCSKDTTAPDSDPGPDPGDIPLAFAGSPACEPCHNDINDIWEESGHPVAMTRVDGVAPVDAFNSLSAFPADPAGPPIPYPWSDITYVAGGYAWKMLWISTRGYPLVSITSGDLTLYSFADREWSFWGSYLNRNDPANCGGCHSTGWMPDDDWDTDNDLSDNQDGLEGMSGKWFAPGIHCEACHGQGNRHVLDPPRFDLIVDRSSADCGRCHFKNAGNDPLGSFGFITANSQFDEWLHSGHALRETVVECVDCHDPHASVKYDDAASGEGTFTTCEGCHTTVTVNQHDQFAPTACVDCHMPFAVRSAMHEQFYGADMRTHLVDISVEPVGRRDGMGMFEGTGELTQDGIGRAKITLDFACYGCHQDGAGEGGSASALNLEQLALLATGIHRPADRVAR